MTPRPQLTLPNQPDAAARARRFIREHGTLDSMRHAEADLLVTELVNNVVRHSPEAAELTVSLDAGHAHDVVVTVAHRADSGLRNAARGAGFTLLDRIAESWSHSFDGSTLSVWFSIRTPGATAIRDELDDEELFERMDEDPAAYSDELVRRHSDLAENIARRYRGKGVDHDDLVQVAHMALLKAIQRYDPSLGTIRPYAASTISGEMKKMLRDRGWSVRVPRTLQERSLEVAGAAEELTQSLGRPPRVEEVASKLGLTEEEVSEAMDARNAYVSRSMDKRSGETGRRILDRLEAEDLNLTGADDRILVESAISRLPERKQRILHLRFNEDLTQAEIADRIGVSQMHISRLLRAAVDELREMIEETRPGE